MRMTLKMMRLFMTRVAIILLAVLFLFAQSMILSADTSKTRAATDKETHKGSVERRDTTSPNSLQVEEITGTDGKRTTTYPDATVITLIPGADPRWTMQSAFIASLTNRTPGGLTYTRTATRALTLSNPNDPLSLITQTDTVSINGRNYTSVYNAPARTFTTTTPAGRQRVIGTDAQGRAAQVQVANLHPASYGFDARGRLASATVGSGSDQRTFGFGYNGEGRLETITDPAGGLQRYIYAAAGRTLADGRFIHYTYDASSNVTSITPPGRPAHSFAYTPVNLISTYTPPDLGAGTNQTIYAYNADRQMTGLTRPDGQTLGYAYDSAGRLTMLTVPGGQYSYDYNAATGNLAGITAPGGNSLSYSYDRSLLTAATWGGTISGSVSRAYDNNFRVTSQTVNGANSIAFQYDNDSLLTRAGSLTLSYNSQNGLLTSTVLGSVSDSRAYNSFAELTQLSAAYNSTAIYSAQYTYDRLGQITQKIETIGGGTDTYDFSYVSTGRLTTVRKNGA
jgi:YD repeat-containing protein